MTCRRHALSTALLCLVLGGCAHRKEAQKPVVPPSGPASLEVDAGGVPNDEATAVERLEANFSRVHFDYDSARLTEEGAALLDVNARILVAHPGLVVEVQGHSDARGATGYNLALGSQRAQAVRDRLMAQGVVADRLQTVTFGEERPRVEGEDALAWAENRRVEFRVLVGDGVTGTVD